MNRIPNDTMMDRETIGRFSGGMERLGPSPEKARAGRFSTGMERLGTTNLSDQIGRFSTGWSGSARALGRTTSGASTSGWSRRDPETGRRARCPTRRERRGRAVIPVTKTSGHAGAVSRRVQTDLDAVHP